MGVGNIANSGLQAAMTNMEAISNNISNANTIGFKKSTVNFSDMYANNMSSTNQVGMGVSVGSIAQDFSYAGTQLNTGRTLDLSLGSDGFFIQNSGGQTSYTRNGQLSVDNMGYIVGLGGRMQGYPAVGGQLNGALALSDLQISNSYLPAKPSSNVSLAFNLDSNAPIPASTFNATDSTSYNYRSDNTVYDSLGNPATMSIFFIKSADNSWTTQMSVDNTSIGTGTIDFQSNGALLNTTGMGALNWSPVSGAVAPQNFAISLAGSTQYASDSAKLSSSQNGYPVGRPISFSIDGSGIINQQYSNGISQIEGQIAVAMFSAPQGLEQSSNMSWLATPASGAPVINQSSSTNAINPGTLENSNVDLTAELVKLMGAQHDFQANAQVAQTYNQMLQTIEKL